MSRATYRFAHAAMLLAAVTILGCPGTGVLRPEMSLTPKALSFSGVAVGDTASNSFTIVNRGEGTLTWNLSITGTDVTWLSFSLPDGTSNVTEGTTTTETDTIVVTVDSAGLEVRPDDPYLAEIKVTSNDTTESIRVSMTVVKPATLTLDPVEVSLDEDDTSAQFTLSNGGTQPLVWSFDIPEDDEWITLSSSSIDAAEGDPANATFTLDGGASEDFILEASRTDLDPDTYTSTVTFSSATTTDSATLDVTMVVGERRPILFVEETLLDFTGTTNKMMTIENTGTADLDYEITPDYVTETDEVPLLAPLHFTVEADRRHTLEPGEAQPVSVQINTFDWPPNTYRAEIEIRGYHSGTDTQVGETHTVAVTIPIPGFDVTPTEIDLTAGDATLTLSNRGSERVEWAATTSVIWDEHEWLDIDLTLDGLEAGSEATVTLSVDTDAILTLPRGTHEDTVTFTAGETIVPVQVVFTTTGPPDLLVTPSLNFFSGRIQLDAVVENPGYGEVAWNIDTSSLPEWLSVAVDGPTTGGMLGAGEAQRFSVSVDRSVYDAPTEVEHEVLLTGDIQEPYSGDQLNASLTVRMTVPSEPVLAIGTSAGIEPGGSGEEPAATLDLGETQTSGSIEISNGGNGTLTWSIDTTVDKWPSWLSISADNGVIPETAAADEVDVIDVTVDRLGVPSGDQSFTLVIESNDGTLEVLVAMTVLPPDLSLVPSRLDFTEGEETLTFNVVNAGGDVLDWTIEQPMDAPWIVAIEPKEGLNVADSAVEVTLSIDRSASVPGLYEAEVIVTSTNGGTEKLPVTMSVPDAELGLTTESLLFEDGDPDTQTLGVVNIGDQGEFLTWNIPPDHPTWQLPHWLTVSPLGGNTREEEDPDTVTVTVDRSNLLAGTHVGTILFEANGMETFLDVAVVVESFMVTPAEVIIPNLETQRSFVIENFRTDDLEWDLDNLDLESLDLDNLDLDIESSPLPTWLSVRDEQGAIGGGGRTTVTVTIDRDAAGSALAPGDNLFVLRITEENPSEGEGDDEGAHKVAVFIVVRSASFTLNPSPAGAGAQDLAFDFSLTDEPSKQQVTITNALDGAALEWSIEISQDAAVWLSIEGPASGTLAASPQNTPSTTNFTVAVDETAVPPGDYEGVLTVTGAVDVLTLTVAMHVPRPTQLASDTLNVSFGSFTDFADIGLWNSGIGTIEWAVDTTGFPAWLFMTSDDDSVTPTATGFAGTASAALENTNSLTLFANRSQLDLILNYFIEADVDGNLRLSFAEIQAVPELAGITQTVFDDFDAMSADGSTGSDGFIDRDEALETYKFDDLLFTADQGADLSMTVSMNITPIPRIEVQSDIIRDDGSVLVSLGKRDSSGDFRILNVGTGTLTWQLEFSDSVSANPTSGVLEPGEIAIVVASVDRSSITSLDDQVFDILVVSNDLDPDDKVRLVQVGVQIPIVPVIGTDQNMIRIKDGENFEEFKIANIGHPDSRLQYRIESNSRWLFAFPQDGNSNGEVPPFYDWQLANISIDRSQIGPQGDIGKFIIRAVGGEVADDFDLEDIEPVEVNVAVSPVPLAFEFAEPHLRVPSMVRFVLLMRDINYRAIQIPDHWIQSDFLSDSFQVFELDNPVDLVATNQFVTSGNSLRTSIAILLDYSASMYEAAQLVDEAPLNTAADPLQTMYETYVGGFINEIPDHYRLALLVFNDRDDFYRDEHAQLGSVVHLIQDFTTDKTALLETLNNIRVTDHGFTELVPAVTEASRLVAQADTPFLAFDNSEIRGIVMITDGRLTTPPGSLADTIGDLAEDRVRFFPLGWGQEVNHAGLSQVASLTGGHYYPTYLRVRTDDDGVTPVLTTGGDFQYDPTLENVPSISPSGADSPGIKNWLTLNAADDLDWSITRDLMSHIAFTYVTGSTQSNVETRIQAAFPHPNDTTSNSDIAGSLETIINFAPFDGDLRMGQISMRCDSGVRADGTADVIVRGEYMPRGITRFKFTMSPSDGQIAAITLLGADRGGLLNDWDLDDTDAPIYVLSARAETGSDPPPLKFASFGDLVLIELESIPDLPADFNLRVHNEIYMDLDADGEYNTPNETKYFLYPSQIPLNMQSESSFAPAFPTPKVEITAGAAPDAPTIIDFGTGLDTAEIQVSNMGGVYPYYNLPETPVVVVVGDDITEPSYWDVPEFWEWVDVHLHWQGNPTPPWLDSSSITDQVTSKYTDHVRLYRGVEEDPLHFSTFTMKRSEPAGVYSSLINLTYDTNLFAVDPGNVSPTSLNVGGTLTIPVRGVVLAPQLTITPADPLTLVFLRRPDGLRIASFGMSNVQQSTVFWTLSNIGYGITADFPNWLSLSVSQGSVGYGGSTVVTFTIDSAKAPAGPLDWMRFFLEGRDHQNQVVNRPIPPGERPEPGIFEIGVTGDAITPPQMDPLVGLTAGILDFSDDLNSVTLSISNSGDRFLGIRILTGADDREFPEWLTIPGSDDLEKLPQKVEGSPLPVMDPEVEPTEVKITIDRSIVTLDDLPYSVWLHTYDFGIDADTDEEFAIPLDAPIEIPINFTL